MRFIIGTAIIAAGIFVGANAKAGECTFDLSKYGPNPPQGYKNLDFIDDLQQKAIDSCLNFAKEIQDCAIEIIAGKPGEQHKALQINKDINCMVYGEKVKSFSIPWLYGSEVKQAIIPLNEDGTPKKPYSGFGIQIIKGEKK